MKNKRSPSRWLKLLGYLFFIFLMFFSLSFFKVRDINCVVDEKEVDEICNNFLFFKDSSFFFTNFVEDESFLSLLSSQDRSYSYYLDDIEKKLPGTLIIKLTTKQPLYRFIKGEESFLVSEEGQYKMDLSSLDVSEVTSGEEWKEEWTHSFVSSLLAEAKKQNIFFEKINLKSSSEVILSTSQHKKIIIEKNNQVEREVERIAVLLNNLDFDSFEKDIREIDMRFNFPVLRE